MANGADPLTITVDSATSALGGTKGDRFAKGLGFKIVNLRVQPTDYSATGLNLSAIARLIGWGKISGVIGQSWTTSPTGTPPTWTQKPFLMVWDTLNNTVRAFKGSAGALVEIGAGDIAANDVVRLILIGG